MSIFATIMRAAMVVVILDAPCLPINAHFILPCRPPSAKLCEARWT
jgi:hypothetical protein